MACSVSIAGKEDRNEEEVQPLSTHNTLLRVARCFACQPQALDARGIGSVESCSAKMSEGWTFGSIPLRSSSSFETAARRRRSEIAAHGLDMLVLTYGRMPGPRPEERA